MRLQRYETQPFNGRREAVLIEDDNNELIHCNELGMIDQHATTIGDT
jgi:hypothetical protein